MAQDFKIDWSPSSIELGTLFWFTSFHNQPVSSLTFRHTTNRGGGYQIDGWSILTTVSFPNLVNLTNGSVVSFTGCAQLATISLPVFVPASGQDFDFSGNALSAATINAFLHRCVLASGYVSGTIDVSGGTSSAPTGAGVTDKATLIGRGVSVFTN